MKALRQHFAICHEEKGYSCGKCNSQFHENFTLRSHLKFCGKLTCTCGKSFRGTQGLERHVKKIGHAPTPLAHEILAKVKRKSKPDVKIWRKGCEPIRIVPNCKRDLFYAAAIKPKVFDQSTQTENLIEPPVEPKWDQIQNPLENRNSSSFACQTGWSDLEQGFQFHESVPVQTEPELYLGNDFGMSTGRDMNIQTDFLSFDIESAATQTDFFPDDILNQL